MRHIRFCAFAAACAGALLLAACGAHDDSAAEAAAKFGLIGRWAPDCSQPPSPGNPYSTYSAASDGDVALKDEGGPDGTSKFNSAQPTGADEIDLNGVYDANDNNHDRALRKNAQGQIRVWRESSAGDPLATDGAAEGQDTPWKTKCS